ncbi:uncharacterized protein LOC107015215 [Solanum pennellii]|uniref:Uncharacterized protein LOC107015215 n=1 Tax=Solanum pennellii TaxID=28526 RepID=A0ABM1GGW0_SOLPN|nr:uncharacterized protein LOC107015215 [Solanum pennellii]
MKKELKTENNNSNGNKRSRVESGLDSAGDSPESKRVNTEVETDPDSSESRVSPNRSDSPESEQTDVYLDSTEAKQIREDILDILEEPDALTECPPEVQDLDSVMKSFEEEILHHSPLNDTQTVLDLTPSESGDSQPDLGYLLEASDDELGLPPTISPANDQVNVESAVMPEAAEFANMAGFEDEMLNYDTFDFGMDHEVRVGDNSNGDFVTVGGLFDYPEPSDFSDFSWRQESLPAL